MGLADRTYMREGDGPGPLQRGVHSVRGMSMWSANTWIIVLCVAVFVIDYFLPPQPIAMSARLYPPVAQQIDLSSIDQDALVYTDGSSKPPKYGPQRQFISVATQPSIPIGERIVYWSPALQAWLHFSTLKGFLHFEFWRLIGFQFLHANLGHIFFNMFALYIFGPLVEGTLGRKRYTAFYLLCGICGALMYVLLNLAGIVANDVFGVERQIPGLLFHDPATPLIGASAGVFGVLLAGAFIAPNERIYLFFLIPLRLSMLAYGLVALSLYSLITGAQNAGGEAGHLGGAIAGFYFIRRTHHLHGFFDFIGRADPSSRHYRKKRPHRTKPHKRDEIDRILAKVKAEGLHSLSAREKRILEQASRSE